MTNELDKEKERLLALEQERQQRSQANLAELLTEYSEEELRALLIAIAQKGFVGLITPPSPNEATRCSLTAIFRSLSMSVSREGDLSRAPQPSSEAIRAHGDVVGYYRVYLRDEYRGEHFDVLRYADGSYECEGGHIFVCVDPKPSFIHGIGICESGDIAMCADPLLPTDGRH